MAPIMPAPARRGGHFNPVACVPRIFAAPVNIFEQLWPASKDESFCRKRRKQFFQPWLVVVDQCRAAPQTRDLECLVGWAASSCAAFTVSELAPKA